MSHLETFSGQSEGELDVTVSVTVPLAATYYTMGAGMRGSDGGATELASAFLGAQAVTLNSSLYREFTVFQAVEGGYILSADMPSGTIDAVATRSTATAGMVLACSFFDGVAQLAPLVELAGNASGGDPFDTSITMGSAGTLVDYIATATDSPTFSTNQTDQTERASEGVSGGSLFTASSTRNVSSGSQTMGWDTDGNTSRTTHLVFGLEDASGGFTINPTLVDSEEEVYSPTITVGKVISPNIVASEEAVFQPTIKIGKIIAPNIVASEEFVYSPTITQGAQVIAPNIVPSEEAVYNPVLIRGTDTIILKIVPSDEFVYRPLLTGGIPVGNIGVGFQKLSISKLRIGL